MVAKRNIIEAKVTDLKTSFYASAAHIYCLEGEPARLKASHAKDAHDAAFRFAADQSARLNAFQ